MPHQIRNRLAVIDLGSNTFHLLVVDLDDGGSDFQEIYRRREYVYLAQSGIAELSGQAMVRGHKCLASFVSKANELGCFRIMAVGTSAIRTASNGRQFTTKVSQDLGLTIDVISGEREAELIFKGVTSYLDPPLRNYNLLIDIGGGSVELILTQDSTMIKYWSIDCGISVIRNVWQRADPPTETDIHNFKKWMSPFFQDLLPVFKSHRIENIVGASGPFEIIESYYDMEPNAKGNPIGIESAQKVIDQVVDSNLASRKKINGMAESRYDLSMESMLLLDYFISLLSEPQKLIITGYALKEGVIAESLNLD